MNNLRRKYWEFSDKHPKLNRIIDKISCCIDRFMVIYTIALIVLCVGVPSLCIYIVLDESIRQTITPIISAVFSVIIVPVVLNHINHLKEEKAKRFEINRAIYEDLSERIVLILKNFDNAENISLIKDFLEKHYSKMCISMNVVLFGMYI